MRKHTLLTRLLVSTIPFMATSISAEETFVSPEIEANTFWGLQFEELEYRDSDELAVWSSDYFYGTDEYKFRWLSKGEYSADESAFESMENQLLMQSPISDFFDAKWGVRFDTPEGADRTYGVLGVAGLAPYWFEVDANMYISTDENISFELDSEYELLFTNRLQLVASFEASVSLNEDKEIALGKGLSSTETGLRMSYDFYDRMLSPYLGVVHEKKYGDSKRLTQAEGGDTEDVTAVIGLRVLF